MKNTSIASLILANFIVNMAIGQSQSGLLRLSGDFGFYSDFYQINSNQVNAIAPRRPGNLTRLYANTSLDVGNFSLPFTISLPFQQQSGVIVSTPVLPSTPIVNFIRNPQNRVGIAPKYKWIQVLLGSQIPQYSELSVGDLPVFGAGFNLTPGKFRFSGFTGTSQLAVEENQAKNIPGIYARKIHSARIGFGDEHSSHIYLIGSMMRDDTSSLLIKPATLMPQSGIMGAIDFRLNLGKQSYLKGEVAVSEFTRDVRSKEISDFPLTLPPTIYTPKESSRLDFASVLSIGADWDNFGIKVSGRYYGDGFMSLGYPFLQPDRFDVVIEPRIALFKKKLQFSGSLGQRVNNLSGARGTTSTQTIGAANLNTQISEKLSLSASFSNFGFRNSVINDTFRVELVTVSWSISPSFYFSNRKQAHNFALAYSRNVFKDFNTISGELNDNDADNMVFSYMLSMVESPLTLGAHLSYFNNDTQLGKLTSKSMGVNSGYKFAKKKIGTTLGFTLADNRIDDDSSGFQVLGILDLKYTLKKKLSFGIRGSVNLFEYGVTRPGLSYTENLLRTSITYKF